MSNNKIIGIDLGTSNSCVSVIEGGKPVVIVNSEGFRTTPSVVGFTKDGERKVGSAAKRQAVTNPKNTIYEVKRLIGNSYDECSKEIKRVSYDIVNENNQPRILVNDKKYTPEEISSMVLQKMKQSAEEYLGCEVKKCVVTVPAYFNDDQRKATKNAAEIAGMECVRIINEPTAAALAYGVDKSDKDMNIVVFDFGGGTFDVSILNFGGGVFEVLSTDGDTHLGGSDIDEKISEWIVDEFKKEEGIDLSKDAMAMQRIKEASEKAKIELSSSLTTEINIPYITANETGSKHILQTLSRSKFETLISDIVSRSIEPCKKAMTNASLKKEDIDEIILVGGTTRIPMVQEAVKKFFGKEANKSVNPDEAVACGASIEGSILNNDGEVNDVVLLDVTPLSLGIETMGGVMHKLIEANTTIPIKKSEIFSTASDNQPAVSIVVCQGERPMAKDNKQIGIFTLDGILPAMRGIPQIEVTFDIDSNGVLSVSATDKGTGKEQHITIESKGGLTDADIERMKKEAEENAEADKKTREIIDIKNSSESLALSTKRQIDELGDKLTDEQKSSLNEKVDSINEALKTDNIDDIKSKKEVLEKEWYSISSTLYGNNQNSSGQQANPFGNFNFSGTNPFGGNDPFSGNK